LLFNKLNIEVTRRYKQCCGDCLDVSPIAYY
jgi:hypothetical protein